MDTIKIVNILQERGYDSRSANLVASELIKLNTPLDKMFEAWLSDASREQDYQVSGYSILSLMEERGMSYPAAILTMDWLIQDPESAIRSLRRGIK